MRLKFYKRFLHYEKRKQLFFLQLEISQAKGGVRPGRLDEETYCSKFMIICKKYRKNYFANRLYDSKV